MKDTKQNLVEDQNKLQESVKKEIDDVRQIIQSSLLEFHNTDYQKYIQNYKKYLGFVHDRLSEIDGWQSNVDYPLVASVVDTMFGNIFDFGYEFGINEPIMKKLCNEAFDFRGSGRETFKEVAKEILIVGKGFVKDYLIKEKQEHHFFDRDIGMDIKTPSMHYVSIFDVAYDRTKGLRKSPFKIIRTFSTGESIKSKVLPLILEQYSQDKHDKVRKWFDKKLEEFKDSPGNRFSMYDYNPVKMLTSVTQHLNSKVNFNLPVCKENKDLLAGWTNGSFDEKHFNYFLNGDKSTFELVEYNTDTRKYIFLNGYIVYFGNKRKNIGELQEANFSMIPGTGNANGVADNLGNLQDINNSLWNAFLDNIKLVMGPMFKVTGNLPIGKNGTLDFKKFKAFRTSGVGDIEKIQLGVTDFAPINFMQIVQGFAEQRSGVNNYVMGGQGAIERVSDGVDVKLNQYKAKLTPITDSIDQMMGNISRSWILSYFTFFSKKELEDMQVHVEEKFDDNGKFKTFYVNGIDIVTIIDERNINFTYNSLEKQTKENSRKAVVDALPFLLQYAGNKVNLDTIAKILVNQDFDPQEIILKNTQPIQGPNKGGRPPNNPQPEEVQDPNAQVDALLEQATGGQEVPVEEQKDPMEQASEDDVIQQIMNIQ